MYWYTGTHETESDQLMRWTHPDDADVIVENAEILGWLSTRRPGLDRWTEITLLGTDAGYAIHGVGVSIVAGETDRHWFKWHAEAFLVVKSLLTAPASGKSSTVMSARIMLNGAAELDEDIAAALSRWRG